MVHLAKKFVAGYTMVSMNETLAASPHSDVTLIEAVSKPVENGK
jgi:hypothetical protein